VETGCRGGQGSPRAVAPKKKKKRRVGFLPEDGGRVQPPNKKFWEELIEYFP
jgi:hypothetical protein